MSNVISAHHLTGSVVRRAAIDAVALSGYAQSCCALFGRHTENTRLQPCGRACGRMWANVGECGGGGRNCLCFEKIYRPSGIVTSEIASLGLLAAHSSNHKDFHLHSISRLTKSDFKIDCTCLWLSAAMRLQQLSRSGRYTTEPGPTSRPTQLGHKIS